MSGAGPREVGDWTIWEYEVLLHGYLARAPGGPKPDPLTDEDMAEMRSAIRALNLPDVKLDDPE